MSDFIPIQGDDLWVKVVEMLQQNWAAIEPQDSGARVYFITDRSQVFDQMSFDSIADAKAGLIRNGFRRFRDEEDLKRLLRAPAPPFTLGSHPNGPIYSSGRFWK